MTWDKGRGWEQLAIGFQSHHVAPCRLSSGQWVWWKTPLPTDRAIFSALDTIPVMAEAHTSWAFLGSRYCSVVNMNCHCILTTTGDNDLAYLGHIVKQLKRREARTIPGGAKYQSLILDPGLFGCL